MKNIAHLDAPRYAAEDQKLSKRESSLSIAHKSNTSRAGSSKLSFTRTRNVTASRPSTMR